LPPLLRILRLNWLRYAAARRTLEHLADAESRRLFLRHVRRHLSFTRLAAPADPATLVPLRIRELGGGTVWCRSGLADLGVVYDTFAGGYHLPPADLGPPRTILDLGSNIGLTIAHFAARFPEARILGVELDEANAALCRRNIAPYGGRCEVLCAAVWHEAGEVVYGGARESGYAVLTGREGRGAKGVARAVTVDALIERLGVETVDYVKMDIEGAEKEVLRDAGGWPRRVRCLKVEVHPEKASTLYTLGMCAADLERHGFRCEVDARHHACILARRSSERG
jgi:FkbM family methyltransferase